MNLTKPGRVLMTGALLVFLGTTPPRSTLAQAAQPPLEGQQAKNRMEAARLQVANVRSNVFLTLVELDRVRGERDPERPRFRSFVLQLEKMQDLARELGRRAEEMKSRGDAYFAEWEVELRQSQPGEDTKRAEAKYADRKQSYDAINNFMQEAKIHFLDFVAILTEIKSLLEHPLAPAQVGKAKDLFGKANWRCIDVQKALMNVEMNLDRLGDSFGRSGE